MLPYRRGGFRENQIAKAFYTAAGADYYRFFFHHQRMNDVFALLIFFSFYSLIQRVPSILDTLWLFL